MKEPPRQRFPSSLSFTLIELLVVMGIIGILMTLLIPALTSLKNAAGITDAAYSIAGYLEKARGYAMANNTFVWVGIYEEAAGTTNPTAVPPPYPGKGRLIFAAVASNDGTTTCEDPNSSSGSRIPLTPALIHPITPVLKVENVHMADIGAPQPGPNPEPNSLGARPASPYTAGAPFDYQNRISSDDTHSPQNQTLYPFVAQDYTFYKTIRFSPAGEASINGTYSLRSAAEIGLLPTHGSSVADNDKNVVAIQFSGLVGNFKIFRQ